MSSLVSVKIHPSQFPQQVRADLLASLRTRRVNHKFLYDSVKQTMKWLELHQAYSPFRTDTDCVAIYDRSYTEVIPRLQSNCVHVVGLGCGGGQKDLRLLRSLRERNHLSRYSPIDVSLAMVLVARQTALEILSPSECFPLVCDLSMAEDLQDEFRTDSPAETQDSESRLFTFFGMLPNFEPPVVARGPTRWLGDSDLLLLSANLAPGNDYAAGVERILPLYDNQLTRHWLMLFLTDLGVEKEDGQVLFRIEQAEGLRRVVGYFEFNRQCQVQVDDERFRFVAGDRIRLFFSYRHTPSLIAAWLAHHGLRLIDQWISHSGEEGVFLAAR